MDVKRVHNVPTQHVIKTTMKKKTVKKAYNYPNVENKTKPISKPISPTGKTKNQKKYLDLIGNKDIVICKGLPGTGKTFLAVGMGVYMLKRGLIDKIIITRPALEAGEKIGFLPGDLENKMDPFVKPIFNSLDSFLFPSEIAELQEQKIIEVIPIGYMRGLTFPNSFVICDECQNVEFDQMKMILTRFGLGSKMVMTGDTDQSDLQHYKRGAFQFTWNLLADEDDVGTIELEECDIQRHKLVGKVLRKWENKIDNFKKTGKM